MASELDSLIRKRAGLKRQVTLLETYHASVVENLNHEAIEKLKMKFDRFKSVLDEFNEIQFGIELLDKDKDHSKEIETFENRYDDLTYKINTTLNNYKLINSENNVNTQKKSVNVKLPTIEIKKFSGSYIEWIAFRDTFKSLIDEVSELSDTQKLFYLQSYLEGEAKQTIQSLGTSGNNYTMAWNLLEKRYDNNRLIVQTHVHNIFSLPTISKVTAGNIRQFTDQFLVHLNALKSLNRPVNSWDDLLVYLITQKLDYNSNREWEHFIKNIKTLPTVDQLIQFLNERAQMLEALAASTNTFNTQNKKHSNKTSTHVAITTPLCKLCKSDNHIKLYNCPQFLSLNVKDRYKQIKNFGLCVNCFGKNHQVVNCKSSTCKHCKEKHNTLLHFSTQKIDEDVATPSTSAVSCSAQLKSGCVILPTATVTIENDVGKTFQMTALLDSGSQINLISQAAFDKLKQKSEPTHITVGGVGDKITVSNTMTRLKLISNSSDYTSNLSCIVIDKISGNLYNKFDLNTVKIPSHIKLADSNYSKPKQIDILIGCELFWEIMCSEQIKLGRQQPILQKTQLGWILSGIWSNNRTGNHSTCLVGLESLEKQIQNFIDLESCCTPNNNSGSNSECEEHFVNNFQQNHEGRFIVKIPFKYNVNILGDSRKLAIRRFLNLEHKFKSNKYLHQHYTEFISEYINLGHMSFVHDKNLPSYFLPHHGIIKSTSLTTKLRVVFDGSAKTDSGWSLNDIQHVGPKIQNDIFNILIRFRKHPIVVIADISKMYRQILVHPDDHHTQCILWRQNPNDELSVFKLNTVTYGTASAPYLAIRCLKQLATQFKSIHPEASNIILNDFYVDDLLTGFNSTTEAIKICDQINKILLSGCFPLRKWTSNCDTLMSSFNDNNEPLSVLRLGESESIKTLGIEWIPSFDKFSYQIKINNEGIVSKRTILSEISTIFDPLGLVSPCIIIAKILIQKLWELKLDWDVVPPKNIVDSWNQLRNELPLLNELKINRHVILKQYKFIEFHGFCDTSTKAYAACIYVKSWGEKDTVASVSLLCSKTRVAPLKTQSIPRLELCSALLLSRLMTQVLAAIDLKAPVHYWSDSKVTLCWLHHHASNLQTFVSNRVAEIQSQTIVHNWHYVNTKSNPADIASRGISPKKLSNLHLWWNGPASLADPKVDYEIFNPSNSSANSLPELKLSCQSLVNIEQHSIFARYSSLNKLKRVFAYCLRFIRNLKLGRNKKQTGALSVQELHNSLMELIKLAQSDTFQQERKILNNNKLLKRKHSLLPLAPFMDANQILRVGGRLKHSDIHYDTKHPILLPGKHILTRLILEQLHKDLLHAGPQLLLANMRQKYWPTSGMSSTKQVVRNCIKCCRYNPKINFPMMADLPKNRVTSGVPFSVTGVDYGGPFILKTRKGRCNNTYKAYLCLFVCFSTKAVHLELVSELSSDAFLATLRRFVSRRGKPQHLYSDNGSNFIGTRRHLSELFKFLKNSNSKIIQELAKDSISWSFNPPSAPHFGGLWESGIKSTKFHLKRVIGDAILTYEEFQTILIQIEGILNSRPLCSLTSDPHTFDVLTPAHFLIGRPLTLIPDPDHINVKTNRLSRWEFFQKTIQSFWNRWSKEYLTSLQERKKWTSPTTPIAVGNIIIIKTDNIPPNKWPLGRVVEVHPGEDSVIRVATIKTKNGIFKRPVTKLCPLPIN